MVLRERSYDYQFRYCGHCNTTTDIKEANFFGRSEALKRRRAQPGWQQETGGLWGHNAFRKVSNPSSASVSLTKWLHLCGPVSSSIK